MKFKNYKIEISTFCNGSFCVHNLAKDPVSAINEALEYLNYKQSNTSKLTDLFSVNIEEIK